MRNLLLPLALSCLLFSCISKKKVDRMEEAYLGQLSSLRLENRQLSGQLNSLRRDSVYLAGANDALLSTQNNFFRRLDQLEEELDRLNQQASMTAQGKELLIQQKEEEIRRLNDFIDQTENLLQRRLERLDQVARASSVALSPYDTLLWEIDYSPTACVISLQEDLLFRRNSTDRFSPNGPQAIKDLADIIQRFPDLVVDVIGHTDNTPVARRDMDNWDYSVLRAAGIARILTKSGLSTNQVLAAGKGEFSPRMSNETAEGRTRNRRIDLVLRFQATDLVRDLNRLIGKQTQP